MKQFFTFSFLLLFFLSFKSFPQGMVTDVPLYGTSFLPPASDDPLVIVTSADGFDNFNMGTDFAEPHMSANPFAPTQFFNAFNINTGHYTLNGWDWTTTSPNFGISPQGDPVTAYDSLGNLYYETMFGSISGCYVIKSTNGGVTWSTGVQSILGVDKNWLAADQTSGPYANYLYTTMTASSGGKFARSTNQGASWTTTYTFNTQVLPGMMVAVGPNTVGGDIPGGCVYVVTHSGTNANGVYTFYLSTDGGISFTQKSQQMFSNVIGTEVSSRSSVQGMRTRPYPFICADNSYGPFRGRLYLVYASNFPVGSGNKPDIFLRYSDDQGATWTSPVTINDDANTANTFQWMPSFWVDKTNGKIYIQWMDTRDVPTNDSCYIYATYSTDGGATFAPNQRISNKAMKINCTTCGGGGTPRYQGDYTSIISNPKGAMAVWMDYRAGTFGSFTAYFPDFAMKTSATALTVNQNASNTMWVSVPGVKLYSDTVVYSASVSPVPAQGSIDFDFSKAVSTSFPDSSMLTISAASGTTTGSYTVTITAQGPNGTPVHKRTLFLTVNNEVPVELVSFLSTVKDGRVVLNWSTATETNNKGFEIYRSYQNNGQRSAWQTVGFTSGAGTSTQEHNYTFTDNKLDQTGKYFYKLKQVDMNGKFEFSHEVEVDINKAISFMLDQNYPNPFNPSTSIKYSVPVESQVRLTIVNSLGQTVDELVNQVQAGSVYDVRWNSGNFSSGVYFYKLEAKPLDGSAGFTSIRKMMLLK